MRISRCRQWAARVVRIITLVIRQYTRSTLAGGSHSRVTARRPVRSYVAASSNWICWQRSQFAICNSFHLAIDGCKFAINSHAVNLLCSEINYTCKGAHKKCATNWKRGTRWEQAEGVPKYLSHFMNVIYFPNTCDAVVMASDICNFN